jgi:ATP synthase subunit 6
MLFNEIKALHSPLEQFEILSFISFTTVEISWIFTFCLLSITSGLMLVSRSDSTLKIIPNNWQVISEDIVFSTILFMVRENIGTLKGIKYFPLVFIGFISILFTNLIGLVPYSPTILSQLVVTSVFALFFFLGINIIGFKKHGLGLFLLIYPAGINNIALAFLLVPMELISYFSKPVSLSVRLFANIVGGHTLLKVIAGFGFILMNSSGLLFFFHYFPLLVLVPLFFLELAVAFIQAFVFSTLICIYIFDGLYLH